MKKLISSLLGPAENEVSRRKFLRLSALGLAVPASSAVLAACQQAGTSSPTGSNSAMEGHDEAGTPSAQTDDKWEEMDRMHEEGVKAFPAKTEGVANEILPYTMDGDVKVFKLTAAITKWQVTQTVTVDAWTYNGAMPGPQIRVTEGDRIRIDFQNNLPESTAIHFHGLIVPNEVDGVPFITQPPVRPGEAFSYEFTVKNPGSHMYHSHYNSTKQVGKGLLGAFVVDPKKPDFYTEKKIDKEYIMILNDANGGFTINGKGFPATEVLTAKVGERILVRYMNEGLMIHPMHLHGFPQEVIAKDGWPQNPWLCDTLNVAPGERWDVIIEPTDVGVWAFHCHVLSHAEGEHGMFGMVTALVVTDENGKVPEKLEYLLAGGRDSAYICKV